MGVPAPDHGQCSQVGIPGIPALPKWHVQISRHLGSLQPKHQLQNKCWIIFKSNRQLRIPEIPRVRVLRSRVVDRLINPRECLLGLLLDCLFLRAVTQCRQIRVAHCGESLSEAKPHSLTAATARLSLTCSSSTELSRTVQLLL